MVSLNMYMAGHDVLNIHETVETNIKENWRCVIPYMDIKQLLAVDMVSYVCKE